MDPRKLRRVLDLYMKRAQIFRHEKQNGLEDHQQKVAGSQKGKRSFQGTPSALYLSDNNLPDCGKTNNNAPNCKHKQSSSERQKLRIRRRRSKNQKFEAPVSKQTEVTNNKDEKYNSIIQGNVNVKDNKAAAVSPYAVQSSSNKFETSNVQSNNPLSNSAQKRSTHTRNVAYHQNSDLPAHSMVSDETFPSGNNAHLYVNSPYTETKTGAKYDMGCVHAVAPLQGGIRSDSSLVDDFSNTRLNKAYRESLYKTESAINNAPSSEHLAFGIGDEGPLNEMGSNQGSATPFNVDEGTGLDVPNSNDNAINEHMDIVNPIILDVLSKVDLQNETGSIDLEGLEHLATINNTRYSEPRPKALAKSSPTDNISKEKSIFVRNKLKPKVQPLTNYNKVASPNTLFSMSHENDLAKSYSQSKSGINDLSTSNLQNLSDTSQISTPYKNAQNLEGMVPSNSKGKEKAPENINKAIHKPAGPNINLRQNGLADSVQIKLKNSASSEPLHSKNQAALHKNNLESDIILRTQLLHSQKSGKSFFSQPKFQIKQKSSKANKQKRESSENTAEVWQQTEDSKIKQRSAGGMDATASEEHGSSDIDVRNENIQVQVDDHWSSSDSRDQMAIGETNQNIDPKSNTRLINLDKRSLKISKEKLHEESFMGAEVQNEEKGLNQADGQSRSTDPLRRKRSYLRNRKHVNKGKRQYRKERSNNLNSDSKSSYKMPYKNLGKYGSSASGDDRVHHNMLRQVEDMIRSLKQENHKTIDVLKSGSRYSHRIGRRLQSVIDEVRDNSGSSNDNDDYYYYDEADVDKHKPEHSKVGQQMAIKENSEPTSVRKREDFGEYVQKPFRGAEYFKTVNIRYSNNDDPSPSNIPNEQVASDLIRSESKKFSLFNKETPEAVREAPYGINNRSSSNNKRSNDYNGNVIEKHNLHGGSPMGPENANQNPNAIVSIPKQIVNERKTPNSLTSENSQEQRLNEGQLAQVNQLLNEIVLNQTPSFWDEIGQDELGYNAHLRYKRADVHKVNASHRNENESIMRAKNVTDEGLRVKESALEKKIKTEGNETPSSVNTTKAVVGKKTEDRNNSGDTISIHGLYIKDDSGGMAKHKVAMHDTSSFLKDGSNIKIGKDKVETKKLSPNTVVNHGYSALEISTPINNEQPAFKANHSSAEVNISQHNNGTQSKNKNTLQYLKTNGSSTSTTSKENYVYDTFPEGEGHLGKNNEPFESHSLAPNDWLGSNSAMTSFVEEGIVFKGNQNKEVKGKGIQHGSSHKEPNYEISEHHEHFTENPLSADTQAQNSSLHDESNKVSGTKFIASTKTRLLTGYVENHAEVSKENPLFSSNLREEKDLSEESSPVLVRNKRNDKNYLDEALQKLPVDFDYSNENGADDYTNNSASYTADDIVLYTDVYTVESSNISETAVDTTPPAIIAIGFINYTSTSSKLYEENSVTSKAPKLVANEYQSFTLPRDFTDDSQLNNTINGALASKMVDIVFEAVNASENLKHYLGSALKKADHGSMEKQPNYETGVSKEMLDEEEEQYHKKTGSLLSKVMELLDVLVEEEASKRSCITLQPELQDFLLWMLEMPQQEKVPSSDFSIPDNFLFMKRNWHPHQQSTGNETGDFKIDINELNHQIQLLKSLITQYVDLPDNEKAKVKYVMTFLKEQLQALERIRSSKHTLHSRENKKYSDESRLSKSHLQSTKLYDKVPNNPKNDQVQMTDKATHRSLPNENSVEDVKTISFGNPEINGLEQRNLENNALKGNSGIRSANNWSKVRRKLEQVVVSAPDEEGTVKSRFSVDHRILTPSHQRKRRYGFHGHGGAKHRSNNVTHLQALTTKYRKLIKRAAEFRRKSVI